MAKTKRKRKKGKRRSGTTKRRTTKRRRKKGAKPSPYAVAARILNAKA